jgi:serine protease 16
MLAAWSRLTFPHLIHAAVASSAPVGAVLNFQGYNDVVGAALGDASVGGDAACVAGARAAFAQLGDALRKLSGRRRPAAAFPNSAGAPP